MRTIAAVLLLLVTSHVYANGECPCPRPTKTCDALVAATLPDLSKTKPAPLNGVFVVLDERVGDWDLALQRLACAGIRHVIIQSVQFDYDEAQELLSAAGRQKCVKVYAGLHYGAFSATALAENQKVAAVVNGWPEEVKKGISGWYIAHELYNEQVWINEDATDKQRLEQTWLLADQIRTYLKATVTEVRAIDKGAVLISPYFVPTLDGGVLTPANTTVFFNKMFKDTGVTHVLLQDSIGARNEKCRLGECRWSRTAFEPQVLPYLQAVQKGLKGTGAAFGVNVEAFEMSADVPCGTATVASRDFMTRRKLAQKSRPSMVVTFSLKHLRDLWSTVTTKCETPY